MNYLSIEHLTKSYGDIILFDDVELHLNEGDKVALVGANGSGKSSLLKIISGSDLPDSGSVQINKNISWAFLTQDPKFNPEDTVDQAIFDSENSLLKLLKEYDYCMNNAETVSPERMEAAMTEMTERNAWDYDVKIKMILSKLKLDTIKQQIKYLSGGQKKRIALAQILIEDHDFLILDEPTNHLDLDMIEWLEDYLSRAKQTILMVTHDRYFLDAVCNEIIDLDMQQLVPYRGNYQYYLDKKEEMIASENSSIDKARNTFKKELEWMRRQPKARTTKSKSRIDAFYEVKKAAQKKRHEEDIKMDVKMTRLGNKIVNMKNVQKAFGDLKVLDGFEYSFQRGERIGIIGKNGVGKSTFLNMIAGLEQQDAGTIDVGDTVSFGYYTQSGIKLNEGKRVLDVVKDIAEVIPLGNGSNLTASAMLTLFNFPPKKQHVWVDTLSGGEKRRLYLLTILMKNPNFLILDEPTNDLDLKTLHTLEDFLLNFQGCVIIVSHDRYFMDKLVDHMFVFEGEGKIRDFNGIYTEYQEELKAQKKESRKESKSTESKSPTTADKPKEEIRKLSYNEKREFEKLDVEVPKLEDKKKKLEEDMSAPGLSNEQVMEMSQELSTLLIELEEKTMRWMELAEFM